MVILENLGGIESLGTIDDAIAFVEGKGSHLVVNPITYDPRNNILSLLVHKEWTRDKYELIYEPIAGKNIVTDDGDRYYAEKGGIGSITDDFAGANGRIELNNPATPDTTLKTDEYAELLSPITASRKILDSTYPKANDLDTFNTGKSPDATTWKVTHTETDFNTDASNNVTGGAFHDGGATPIATTHLLTHFNYTLSFKKQSTDQLITWINHLHNGV